MLSDSFILKNFIKTAPDTPGVYQMKDISDIIIYVGKAKNLKKRLLNYVNLKQQCLRIQKMILLINKIEIIQTKTEIDALILESELIKKFSPKFNILLKDDKSFPFICITNDQYPRLQKYRGNRKNDFLFFGPFVFGTMLNQYIEELCKIFQIRTCSNNFCNNRARPCLRYFIKRCSAPCVQKISHADYKENVLQMVSLLKHKNDNLLKELHKNMINCSKSQEFEKAAILRDRINIIKTLKHHMGLQLKNKINIDFVFFKQNANILYVRIFSFELGVKCMEKEYCLNISEYITDYQNNSNDVDINNTKNITIAAHYTIMQYYLSHIPKNNIVFNEVPFEIGNIIKALELKYNMKIQLIRNMKNELLDIYKILSKEFQQSFNDKLNKFDFNLIRTFLKLHNDINRIEIYDNSHLHGTNPCGGVVCAIPVGFDKQYYKSYYFESNINGGNDYFYLQKTLTNRLMEKNMILPDLFVIDGGIAQLNIAKNILGHLNIPILAISKDKHRNSENFHPSWCESFNIATNNNDVLFLFQRLIEEAHNFIINTHRRKRNKQSNLSVLDDIPGIGKIKKKKLYIAFGTIQNISKASIQNIVDIGISPKDANTICTWFKDLK